MVWGIGGERTSEIDKSIERKREREVDPRYIDAITLNSVITLTL